MTNIVVLNSQDHRDLRVQAGASAPPWRQSALCAGRRLGIPRARRSIIRSSSRRIRTPARSSPAAMLGFHDGENLFLSEVRKGQDSYRPLNLRRQPFYVAGADLAIDLDSPRVNAARGEALFAPDGEPTPYLQSIVAAFRDLRPGIEMTKVFIDTLLSLKLIEPIAVDLGFDDGSKLQLVDIYTIDKTALRDLPDATVLDLFRRGYLHLIYLMIASLKQIPVLAQKKKPAAARKRRMTPVRDVDGTGIANPAQFVREIAEPCRPRRVARPHRALARGRRRRLCAAQVPRLCRGFRCRPRRTGLLRRAAHRRQVLLRRRPEGLQFRAPADGLPGRARCDPGWPWTGRDRPRSTWARCPSTISCRASPRATPCRFWRRRSCRASGSAMPRTSRRITTRSTMSPASSRARAASRFMRRS